MNLIAFCDLSFDVSDQKIQIEKDS